MDNALMALAVLVETCECEEVPRATSLDLLLSALPLREDFDEGVTIYSVLIDLLKKNDPAILSLMPKVLTCFQQAFDARLGIKMKLKPW